MGNNFFRIKELLSVHQQKEELERKEIELSIPVLTNLEYVPEIYDWFCEFAGYEEHANLRVDDKLQFLFIMEIFYTPISLTGCRTVGGFRRVLTWVLGYKSRTIVSNYQKCLLTNYYNYRKFREQVEARYSAIYNRLKEREMIP